MRSEFCLNTYSGNYCLTQIPIDDFVCPKCNQSFSASLMVPGTEIISPVTKNQYSITEFINRGGSAVVYQAINQDQQECAIKEGNFGEINTNSLPFEVLKHLKHTQLVSYLERFTLNFREYIVQEYLNGNDLYGLELNEAEAVSFAQQVARPINHLHSQDIPIIHLDITPGNIMLLRNRGPVLIDLEGSAFVNTPLEQVTGMGTESFAAIEQYQGVNKPIGPFTDVYALAATMYYLVTKEKPFSAMQRLQMLQLYQRDPLENMLVTPNFSNNFINSLAKGLSLHPGNRPQSINQFIKGLTSTRMSMRG